jgi:hypothetical protein
MYKDELFAAGNISWLHGFVAGAALGIQKAQQFRQRLGVRRIAQKRAFAPHFHQVFILQFVQMV